MLRINIEVNHHNSEKSISNFLGQMLNSKSSEFFFMVNGLHYEREDRGSKHTLEFTWDFISSSKAPDLV